MAETISLSDYVDSKSEEIFDAVIVETKDGNVSEVAKSELVKYDPQNVNKIIPKPPTRDIIDGSSVVAKKYLQKEFALMNDFFTSRGVETPKISLDLDTKNEWSIVVDFPIPKKLQKADGTFYYREANMPTERFLFLINDYPNMPPVGFHVTHDAPKEMRDALKFIFGTHVYDKVLIGGVDEKTKDFLAKDWTWICFHYGEGKWNFDRNFWKDMQSQKLVSKSSLTGYFYYIYYRMIGAFNVSSE